jgi:phage N-6-adenine-methyltransferase
MKGQDTLFSKASDEWSTPLWLFQKLDTEFKFDLDGACTRGNCLCRHGVFAGEFDALQDYAWSGFKSIWLNPPHSKIAAFMKKAYDEMLKGAVVVCLIPCRTDTQYWHNYVMMAHEIRFIMGRLKFGDSKNSAPFPSCIVIFDHSKYDKNNDPIFKTLKQPVKP